MITGYALINVNPVGGGSAGKGWGFDQGIHLLSGRFDWVPLLRGRDIWFVRQRDWGQDKAWLPGIVFLVFGMARVPEKVSFFTDIYLLLHRPSIEVAFHTELEWYISIEAQSLLRALKCFIVVAYVLFWF